MTIKIEHEGEVLSMMQWAKRSGVRYITFRHRYLAGYPMAACMTHEDMRPHENRKRAKHRPYRPAWAPTEEETALNAALRAWIATP